MARLPRIVLPGIPHRITQRGNRRGQTFFEDGDYELYPDLPADGALRAGVEIWSYCLMPNHRPVKAMPSGTGRLQGTLLGTIAATVAVIAVAAVGFMMLTVRLNWRYGSTAVIGCLGHLGSAVNLPGFDLPLSVAEPAGRSWLNSSITELRRFARSVRPEARIL